MTEGDSTTAKAGAGELTTSFLLTMGVTMAYTIKMSMAMWNTRNKMSDESKQEYELDVNGTSEVVEIMDNVEMPVVAFDNRKA